MFIRQPRSDIRAQRLGRRTVAPLCTVGGIQLSAGNEREMDAEDYCGAGPLVLDLPLLSFLLARFAVTSGRAALLSVSGKAVARLVV